LQAKGIKLGPLCRHAKADRERYHQQSSRVIKLYPAPNFGYQASARRHALAVFDADTAK
jgi:hypothetical protein